MIIKIFQIITLICNICVIIINIKLIKKLSQSNSTNNDEEKVNYDDYLNSLQFNTLLDELIRPLLGNYKNEDIVTNVTDSLFKYHFKNMNINRNDVKLHVADVLLNYNNSYEEENKSGMEFIDYDNDEIVDYYKNHDTRSQSVDLSSSLNSFYKD